MNRLLAGTGDLREALRSAAHRVGRLWRPMAAWTLLVWGALVVLVTPLTSGLLGAALLRGRRELVGNEEILAWVLTPAGLVWCVVAGSLVLVVWVVRFAGLFHIITDDLEGDRPSIYRTFLDLAPRVPALLRLCVATVAAGLVLAVPYLLGLLAIRALLLGQYDINYYLAERNNAWTIALAAGAAWTLVWGIPVAYLAARTVLALPARLDGHGSIRAAVRRAWELSGERGATLLPRLLVAAAGWIGVRIAAGAAYAVAGAQVVAWVTAGTDSLRVLALAAGAYVAGLLVMDAVIGFLGFALLATLLTKYYHENTPLHQQVPPGARLGHYPAEAVRSFRRRFHPARAIPVVLVLFVGSIGLADFLLGRLPDPVPLTIIAHRGGPPPSPENTLAALERAIDAGAHMTEIDVQRTLDGVVVVVHDADLMRMAGTPLRVRDTRYADLAHLVQQPDDGSPPAERRVATLGEFLDRARGRIIPMIELKFYGPDPELVDEVIREVRNRGMEQEVALMSLDLPAVERALRIAPEIEAGYVVAATVGRPTTLPVAFLAVVAARLDGRFQRQARQGGMKVYAWTVNDASAMAALSERGIDGVITDHPATARRVNDRLGRLSPASRVLLRFLDLLEDDDQQ